MSRLRTGRQQVRRNVPGCGLQNALKEIRMFAKSISELERRQADGLGSNKNFRAYFYASGARYKVKGRVQRSLVPIPSGASFLVPEGLVHFGLG